MKKYLLILITLFTLFPLSSIAQEDMITVSGVVKDATNDPLVGVNIVVKDKPGFGTITDVDGKFKIKITPYSTLIFSYIGYTSQEILVKNARPLNITLKESESSALTEVVVTGTGIQKKASLTGAITTVDLKTLKTPSPNITNALAGNVAGVIAMQSSGEPGATSEFWIRGVSTFGAGASALILVDGFERDLNDINVEDIQSFSILKDASATAIYGSKGANGVILITTKRGNVGKVNISVKAESSYNTRTRTPEFVDGYTYAQMMNEARITRNLEPEYTNSELEIFKQNLDPDLYPNVNWQDILLKDGAMSTRAAINLDGGSTLARYFVSASFFDEQGMYKTDKAFKNEYNTNLNAKRWNYRMNVDIDLTKTTLIKVGLSGSLKQQNSPGKAGDIWHSIVGQNPVSIPVMYSNGLVPAYGTGNQTNPWVLATQTGYNEFWENSIQTNVTLEQNLDFVTKGLRFVGRYGFDTYNDSKISRVRWPEQYRAERRRDENGNLILKRISPEQLMSQTSESAGRRFQNFEAELHYDRTIAKDHRLGGMVKYIQNEEVMTVNVGEDIKNGISKRHQGVSGRVVYGYQYRYFAEFNFGYTGSENFARGHQFGFFPAVSVGWNIAEERFIRSNAKWLDMFKIRYSYGEVGNDRIADGVRFPYLSSFGDMGGYDYGDYNSSFSYNGYHYSQVASLGLTWEVAKKHNLGVDWALFGNKITGTVDVFRDTREDIYMQRKHLAEMIGITSQPWANVGRMRSTGVDGNVAYNQKIGEVVFTMRGNMTLTKNEVLAYDEEAMIYPYKKTEGFRWDQARGLIAQGLFKDYEDIRNSPRQTFGEVMPGDIKYKDVNGDGVINDDDIVPIGATRVPSLIYGVGASAQWKGFDFNVHFQGAGKSSYFIDGATVYPFSNGSWGNVLTDVVGNRWISREISGTEATENPNAKYPRLSYGGNNNNYRRSTYWLRNGAYLRFKTLEVGYTIPKRVINKVRIDNLRLFLLGNNLMVWDSLKLWDPELASGDGMKYPLARTFTLGVTLNF